MQKYENFTNFAPRKRHVPVVQWIEYRIPVPTIRVRLPTGIQVDTKISREQNPVMQPADFLFCPLLFAFNKKKTYLCSAKAIFAPLKGQLEWWNGRHEGLKILWSLRPCGFKSRFEHRKKSAT